MSKKILIIGSGIAGIAASLKLKSYGLSSTIVDKANFIGGRISTRIDKKGNNDFCFFHGAQFFTARSENFKKIIEKISIKFELDDNCEITIEANPGTVDKQYFYGYKDVGINRMSLGIQSFNEKHLKKLERIHNQQEAIEAANLAVKLFDKVNIDLMFALPGQTQPELNDDIEMALAIGSSHISYYHLTIEPNTFFHKHPPKVPNQDDSSKLFDLVREELINANFNHYETSAYAKKGNQCRHNLNYWNFGDYLGIGAGAHSKITNDFNITRFSTYKNPKQYIQEVNNNSYIQEEHLINKNDIPFEFKMKNVLEIEISPPLVLEFPPEPLAFPLLALILIFVFFPTLNSLNKIFPLISVSSSLWIVLIHLTSTLLFEGLGYIEKSISFVSSTKRRGQLPSDSQLPKQCCIIVSDVITGITLSLKLDETPHG